MEKLEKILEFGGIKKDLLFLFLSGFALLNSIFHLFSLPFDTAWIAIIFCGIPILCEAMIGLLTEFDIKADVLVSIALLASIFIGEIFAAGEVAFIMQLGALLEDLTVAKAHAGIEKLLDLNPTTARIIENDKERIIQAKDVQKGDILRVLAGETIPVDGIIQSGHTSINQAVMTGESIPVDKTVGDEVSSGCVNQFGPFDFQATHVGEDSSIQRMIRLVQSADAKKAKIVGLADRWATWIVIIALSAAFITWLFSGQIIRAVTILVVFCPCSLVLATPTAIMAAIGNCTKHGFLVRQGDALERLSKVTEITFDKTGTLTYGIPAVVDVINLNDEVDLLLLCASIESYSEHPLGKAIVKCCNKELLEVKDFKMIPGQGVQASIKNQVVIAGNEKMLKDIVFSENKNVQSYLNQGCTIIYVAIDYKAAGYLVLSDTLRKESKQVITQLKKLNVEPILLTGDHRASANAIAKQLEIRQVHAQCLPEDKLAWIELNQKKGEAVCMIGDGINDAPALKIADVGIAMGGIGSDIAIDAADLVLVEDEIGELTHLIALSKRMMHTIHFNLTFSMLLNFIAIILAITGILNPVIGALVHNAGSVFVITNSAFLLSWRENKYV